MKGKHSKLKFASTYALKNISSHPMRSLLVIIGFFALFTTMFLGSTIPTFFKAFFYGEFEEQYQHIDLKVTVDPTSDARIFQTRGFSDEHLSHVIDDVIPFFEIDLLVETSHNERFYAHLFSSTLTHFKKVANDLTFDQLTLSADEVIITRSIATDFSLNVFDEITLYSNDLSRTFHVVDIVEDGKLFRSYAIYLDKSVSLNFFLESINPSYASLNPVFLSHIHNTVYLDINDDITLDDAINLIKENPSYAHLKYTVTIDPNFVNQMINRNISVFNMFVSVIILAVLLVLYTTILIYFEDKKKMFAIIDTLGGSKLFSLSIVLIEILIFFIISISLSLVSANLIIAYGIQFLNSPISYQVPISNILIVSGIVLLMLCLTTVLFFNKFNQNSMIQQTKDEGAHHKSQVLSLGFISIGSLLIYLALETSIIKSLLNSLVAPFQIILSLLFLISFGSFLMTIVTTFFTSTKKPFVFFLHLKIMLTKKAFYQYFSVLLISSLSLYLLVLANNYMDIRRTAYQDQYQLDYIVTNIFKDFDQTLEEIQTNEHINHASQVGLFQDVPLVNYKDAIRDVVSMNPSDIYFYFDLDIKQEYLETLSNDYPVILLPVRFHKLYDMNINDSVVLNISPDYPDLSFVIGGFYEKQLGNLAITNISHLDTFTSLRHNAIFVKSAGNPEALKNDLLDAYSNQFIYIIDYQRVVSKLSYEMIRATEYLNGIIIVILCCFVLSIMNHSSLLLAQMKNVYSKLYVLGYTYKKMFLLQFYEGMILLFIVLATTFTTYVMIGSQLIDFILFFGEYEPVRITSSSILWGSILIISLFIATRLVYVYRTKHLQIQDVLKVY